MASLQLRNDERGRWLALATIVVGIKALWLIADHTPMLFLGDSESYLATAVIGWIPPDRSFLYGFLLRPLALAPGSLLPLLVAQAACSVVAGLLLAYALANLFAVPWAGAFAATVAWAAFEPLSLLYERYVMTEAAALPAFALFVVLALKYLAQRRVRDVVLANAVATLVIAFRSVFVPISLLFAVALPVLAHVGLGGIRPLRTDWRSLALALLASVAAAALFHQAYKITNGHLSERPSAYQYHDGLFLLAAWAPVVRAGDFRDPALGAELLAASGCAQDDRRLREAQRWYSGCLVDLLRKRAGGEEEANAIAREAAYRALRRDPAAVFRLGWVTWLDNFDASRIRDALHWDRGERAYSTATVALLRDRLGVAQAAELHRLSTPTNRWFHASTPWVMMLAGSPLIAVAAIFACPAAARRRMVFAALLAGAMIGANALASTGPVPRYLHAAAWLAMIPLAVIAARLAGALQPLVRPSARPPE